MPDTGRRTTLVAMLEDAPCQTRGNAPRRSQRWRTRHARRRQTHHTGRNAGGRAMPDTRKRTTLVATLENAPCQTLADAPRWSQRWRTRHTRRPFASRTHGISFFGVGRASGRNVGGRAMPDAPKGTTSVATLEDAPCQTLADAPRRRTTSVPTLEDAPCQTLADAPRWSQRWRTRRARRGQTHHIGRNAGGRATPDVGRCTTLVAAREDAPCQT